MTSLKIYSRNVDQQLDWLIKNSPFAFKFQNEIRTFKVFKQMDVITVISENGYSCSFSLESGSLDAFPGQSLDPLQLEEPTALIEFLIQVAQSLGLKTLNCNDSIASTNPNPDFLLRHAYLLMYGQSWLDTLDFKEIIQDESKNKREATVREGNLSLYASEEGLSKELEPFLPILKQESQDDDIGKQSIAYIFEVLWKKKAWKGIDALFKAAKIVGFVRNRRLNPKLEDKDPILYVSYISERIFYDPELKITTLDNIFKQNLSIKQLISELYYIRPDGTFRQWVMEFKDDGRTYKLPVFVDKTKDNTYYLIVYSDRPLRLDADPFLDAFRKNEFACLRLEFEFDVIHDTLSNIYIANINNYSKCANPYLSNKGGGKVMVNFALAVLVAFKSPYSTIIDAAQLKSLNFGADLATILLTKNGFGYYEKFGFVPNISTNFLQNVNEYTGRGRVGSSFEAFLLKKMGFFDPKLYDEIEKVSGVSIPQVKAMFDALLNYIRVEQKYEEFLLKQQREGLKRLLLRSPGKSGSESESEQEFDVSSVESDVEDFQEQFFKELDKARTRYEIEQKKLSRIPEILVWLPLWSKAIKLYRLNFIKNLDTKPISEWIGKDYKKVLTNLLNEDIFTDDEGENYDIFAQIFFKEHIEVAPDEFVEEAAKQPLKYFTDAIVNHNKNEDYQRAKAFVAFMTPYFYGKIQYLRAQIIDLSDRFAYSPQRFFEQNIERRKVPYQFFSYVPSSQPSELFLANPTEKGFLLEFAKYSVIAFHLKTFPFDLIVYNPYVDDSVLSFPSLLHFRYPTNLFDVYLNDILLDASVPEQQLTPGNRRSLRFRKADIILDLIEIMASSLNLKRVSISIRVNLKNIYTHEIRKLLRNGTSSFDDRGCTVPQKAIDKYTKDLIDSKSKKEVKEQEGEEEDEPEEEFHRNVFLDLLIKYTEENEQDPYEKLKYSMRDLVSKVTIKEIYGSGINQYTGIPWKEYLPSESSLSREFSDLYVNLTIRQIGEMIDQTEEDLEKLYLRNLIVAIFYFDEYTKFDLSFDKNIKKMPKTIMSKPIRMFTPLFA